MSLTLGHVVFFSLVYFILLHAPRRWFVLIFVLCYVIGCAPIWSVCVCVYVHVYASRIVSMDKILRFTNTFIIIIIRSDT